MTHVPRLPAPLLTGLLILALGACGSFGARGVGEYVPKGAGPGGQVLTQAEIQRTGARDAFEALERGNTYLIITNPGGDHPAQITYRGASSLFMGNAILLVVDGARVKHSQQMLRSIPAESIHHIRILSGREASVLWGSEAANGVIMVQTTAAVW